MIIYTKKAFEEELRRRMEEREERRWRDERIYMLEKRVQEMEQKLGRINGDDEGKTCIPTKY